MTSHLWSKKLKKFPADISQLNHSGGLLKDLKSCQTEDITKSITFILSVGGYKVLTPGGAIHLPYTQNLNFRFLLLCHYRFFYIGQIALTTPLFIDTLSAYVVNGSGSSVQRWRRVSKLGRAHTISTDSVLVGVRTISVFENFILGLAVDSNHVQPLQAPAAYNVLGYF
jgi:hypothetical protein